MACIAWNSTQYTRYIWIFYIMFYMLLWLGKKFVEYRSLRQLFVVSGWLLNKILWYINSLPRPPVWKQFHSAVLLQTLSNLWINSQLMYICSELMMWGWLNTDSRAKLCDIPEHVLNYVMEALSLNSCTVYDSAEANTENVSICQYDSPFILTQSLNHVNYIKIIKSIKDLSAATSHISTHLCSYLFLNYGYYVMY